MRDRLLFASCLIVALVAPLDLDTVPHVQFTSEPADVTVSKGQEARLDCVVANGAPDVHIEIQWRRNGIPIDLRTKMHVLPNASLLIPPVGIGPLKLFDNGEADFYQCAAVVNNQWVYVSRRARYRQYNDIQLKDKPYSRTVAVGSTIMMPCNAEPASAVVLMNWFKDGAPFSAVADRVTISTMGGFMEIRNVQPSDTGTYECQLRLSDGQSLTSDKVRLNVNGKLKDQLSFETKPAAVSVLAGQSAVMTCVVNGSPKPQVVWFKGGVPVQQNARVKIIGESSLRISNVRQDDHGAYTCKAFNARETVTGTALLTVLVPPIVSLVPKKVIIDATDKEATFQCHVSGRPTPSVTWLKNGEVIVSSDYFRINGTHLKISGVIRNDQGVYQCLADNEHGSAQASAVLLVDATDATPSLFMPPVSKEPTDLQAYKVGSRYVVLRWKPPTAPGEASVIGYSVLYKGLGSQREHQVNCTPAESTGFTVSGLFPEKTYYFKVAPITSNGYGPFSSSVAVLTAEERDNPSAVQNLYAYPLSSTTVKVEWEPPLTAQGRDGAGFYKIFYAAIGWDDEEYGEGLEVHDHQESPSLDADETEIQTRNTSYVLHGLQEYTKYRFRVEAVHDSDTSQSSTPVYCKTYSDRPSAPPASFSVTAVASDRMLVRWSPPEKQEQNGKIIAYKIRYKLKDRSARSFSSHVDGGNEESYIANLEPGETYMVRVAAATINGTGPYSAWKEVVMVVYDDGDETQVPGAPTSLRLQATSSEITLNWTPPADDDSVIRGYLIGWGINVPDIQMERVPGTARTFTITNLRSKKDYVVSLKAFNKLGNGFPIYETVRTTDKSSKDVFVSVETPIGLRAVTLSSTAIALSWTDRNRGSMPAASVGSNEPYYTVRYTSHYVFGGRYRYVNTSESSYVIDGLRPDTQYEFSVKAALGRFDSEWSMTALNRTFSSAPSSAPRDLTTINSDSDPTTVVLNWQPPKHPNGKITKYLIYYTSEPKLSDSSWMVEGIRGDRMSTTIDGLSPEKDYFFKIQAVNDRGYGPISTVKPYQARRLHTPLSGVVFDNDPSVSRSLHGGDSVGSSHEQRLSSSGLSWNTLSTVIVAVCCTVALLIVIMLVYLYRQRLSRTRGYTAGIKKTTPRDAKPPPDLWIHHEQHMVEMRVMDRNNGIIDETQFQTSDEKLTKVCRTPTPPAPDVPRYQSLAHVQPVSNGSLSKKRHHMSSNSVDAGALSSARSHLLHGRAAGTPHVVYTGAQSGAQARLLLGDCATTGEECGVPSSPVPTPPIPNAAADAQSDASGSTSRSGNPLRSFALLSVPPPPPPVSTGSSSTALGGKIQFVRPTAGLESATQTGRRVSTGSGKPKSSQTGSSKLPLRSSPMSPRMTGSVSDSNSYMGKDSDCEVMRSYSTEELTAQMQNLDNLMQDLNAISANEFDL